MNKKYFKPVIGLLAITVTGSAFAAGIVSRQVAAHTYSARLAARLTSLDEMAPGGGNISERNVDFGPMDTFLMVLKLIRKNYVDKIDDAKDTQFALGAIDGMLASLQDPYSRLITPAQREVMEGTGSGNYQGIGVILGARQQQEDGVKVQKLVVVSPVPGSPAEKAGIQPGDIIAKIDGKTVIETPSEGRPSQGMKDLIDRLRKEAEKQNAKPAENNTPDKAAPQAEPKTIKDKGSAKPADKVKPVVQADEETIDMHDAMDSLTSGTGNTISVVLKRPGVAKTITLNVAKAATHAEPVEAQMLDSNTLYLKLAQTSDSAREALEKALKNPTYASAHSVVIDLRHSPGGPLDSMVQIAGNFIPGQVVTRVAKRNGTPQVISAPNQAGSRFRRMVVLVDQGTASTSEILAAALHEKAHAQIVGAQTFGDTRVQTVIPLRDGSAVILTTGKLLSPTGVDLVGKGMKPDVVLAGTPAGSITEDLAVKKALSLLKS